MQSRTKFMKQCREIQKNWIGLKNFDICFCVTFEQQYNSFTFGRATAFQALPPPIFEVFPVFSYFFKTFPKLSSNSCILHKISSTTLLVANRSYPKILKILKILKFSLFMRAIKHSGKLCFYCCWSVRQGIQIYKQSPAKEFFAKFVSYFWQKMSPWAFEMVVNTPLLFLSQKKKDGNKPHVYYKDNLSSLLSFSMCCKNANYLFLIQMEMRGTSGSICVGFQ